MKYTLRILNWAFGTLAALVGASLIMKTPIGSIALFMVAALLWQPVRDFVYARTKKKFPLPARILVVSSLLLVFFTNLAIYQRQVLVEVIEAQAGSIIKDKISVAIQDKINLIVQEQVQNLKYFKTNQKEIMTTLKADYEAGKYEAVLTESNKYLVTKNLELLDLNAKARQMMNTQ